MNEDEKLTEENDLEDYDTVEVEQKDKQETTGSVVEDYPNLSIKIEQTQILIALVLGGMPISGGAKGIIK